MNQSEIEAFLAVIECGSISAAAQSLYLGQPTLSARINTLEQELNAKLFHRSRGQKNTELTVAGKNFEPYARRWIGLWAETKTAVNQKLPSTLHIAAGHSINAYIMPEIYFRLSCRKDCSFRIATHHYYEVYKMVERDEVDIGIVSNTQYSRGLHVYPLFQEQMVLLLHEQSELLDPVHPGELDINKEIYLEWDENFGRWHRYWLGLPAFSTLQTADVTFAERCIRIDRNWAIVPLTIARILCRKEGIRFCRLSDEPEPRTISLVCKNKWSDYFAAGEILERMEEEILRLGGVWLFDKSNHTF